MHLPYLVSVSVSVRKVIETRRLEIQFVAADMEFPVDRAHSGYISALIVHGMGPMPSQKTKKRMNVRVCVHVREHVCMCV